MPEPTAPGGDVRTVKEVMTQWRKLAELKRGLVRDGLLDGNATPAEIIAKIREALPPDVFG